MVKKSELGELADDIKYLAKNFPKYVKESVYEDASYLGEQMLSGYENYINMHTNYDYDGAFTHISSKDPQPGAQVWIIRDNEHGVRVGLRGDNVAYYEFGTGSIGKGLYPDNVLLNESLWRYGAGPKILQHGKWKNAHFDEVVPKWYKTMLKKGTVSRADTVWMYNGSPRRGLSPGQFIYDAIEEFETSLDASDDGYITKADYKLSRKGIYGYVSASIDKK